MAKVLLVLLGALLAVPAGDKDAAKRTLRLVVAGFSSEPDRVSAGTAALADLQVEEVWLSLGSLGLRDAAACDEPGKAHVAGPVTAELIAGRASGLPKRIDLAAARFCGVDLTLRRARGKAEGTPAELRGHAILVRARREDGTRVVVRSKSEARLWLAAADSEGFAAPEDGARWVLAADLARWLGGLDLGTAEVSRQGGTRVIRIDARNNSELLATFEGALAAGLGLYADGAGEGRLAGAE